MIELGKEVPTKKLLNWRRVSIWKREYQLTNDGAVFASVIISGRNDIIFSGSFANHEYVMHIIRPPRIPYHYRTRKDFRQEYLISLTEKKDNSGEEAWKEFGRLEYGLEMCLSPTQLILQDGRVYSIICNQISKDFRTFSLATMNTNDEGRLIGITRRARTYGKLHCTFQLDQYENQDPPAMLIASVVFAFSTLVSGREDWDI